MGINERREREKEALRTRIVEAARDIVSEEGLHALSMRAIAERIEYSPATIYLYFRDKTELVGEVVRMGFRRLGDYVREQLAAVGADADPGQQHRSIGRAYARFALENTAYFRVMFELPSVAQVDCPGDVTDDGPSMIDLNSWEVSVATVQRGIDEGIFRLESAERGAIIAWGLLHGLTSLYLTGHLGESVDSNEGFLELVESAMDSLGSGWAPRETLAREEA